MQSKEIMMKKHQKVSAVMIYKRRSWNQLLKITFEPTTENSNIVKNPSKWKQGETIAEMYE